MGRGAGLVFGVARVGVLVVVFVAIVKVPPRTTIKPSLQSVQRRLGECETAAGLFRLFRCGFADGDGSGVRLSCN